jgi:hypothetical protein
MIPYMKAITKMEKDKVKANLSLNQKITTKVIGKTVSSMVKELFTTKKVSY